MNVKQMDWKRTWILGKENQHSGLIEKNIIINLIFAIMYFTSLIQTEEQLPGDLWLSFNIERFTILYCV